jgi:hypothetical protein
VEKIKHKTSHTNNKRERERQRERETETYAHAHMHTPESIEIRRNITQAKFKQQLSW